ncbi:Hypothetical protein CAP_8367 [Chondromyces apiculatus DSM 436]|uniref:Uncharacterized protein n=1 Tax=Chondromyces apiculatus DSM 436 TaxID=1192034 RepID=A0A017SXH6_9BACT|nr:Hypothetical protein CAP_8367 [Chondromyces apiculatus DSM 436]
MRSAGHRLHRRRPSRRAPPTRGRPISCRWPFRHTGRGGQQRELQKDFGAATAPVHPSEPSSDRPPRRGGPFTPRRPPPPAPPPPGALAGPVGRA